MKIKKIVLLLAISVFAFLVFIVVSCKKFTCFNVSDLEECKKKCGVKLFSPKKNFTYNDVDKQCCCAQ